MTPDARSEWGYSNREKPSKPSWATTHLLDSPRTIAIIRQPRRVDISAVVVSSARQRQYRRASGEIMTKRPRRHHAPAFKAKVALAALEGQEDADRVGAGFRCSSETDHSLEIAIA
jgi:hypothetical protein